jgi:hypothetical protein
MATITVPSMNALGLPFCSAARAGDLLCLSGAIGNQPGAMALVEGGFAAGAARRWTTSARSFWRASSLGFADARLQALVGSAGASGLALGDEVEAECVSYWPRER